MLSSTYFRNSYLDWKKGRKERKEEEGREEGRDNNYKCTFSQELFNNLLQANIDLEFFNNS